MGSYEILKPQLPTPWRRTPLIESRTLSRAAGCRIFLKLENLQPSSSFKSRGIGNLILSTIQARQSSPNSTPSNLHFYSSSGGNAGLAAVTAARTLGYPCSVVVPTSTEDSIVYKLKAAGATEVIIHGESWLYADKHLREVIMPGDTSTGTECIHVPPFDHPRIWEGAATMVEEMRDQLPNGDPPEGIVCSVGGGGLFCGVMLGLENCGWQNDVRVAAVETKGAESLAASLKAGELVTLPAITSVAKSLGASRVAEKAFEYAQNHSTSSSVVLPDADACMACVKFADDERILVEPACGASVAMAYNPKDLRAVFPGMTPDSKIVIVVCGGSRICLEELEMYKKKYGP